MVDRAVRGVRGPSAVVGRLAVMMEAGVEIGAEGRPSWWRFVEWGGCAA